MILLIWYLHGVSHNHDSYITVNFLMWDVDILMQWLDSSTILEFTSQRYNVVFTGSWTTRIIFCLPNNSIRHFSSHRFIEKCYLHFKRLAAILNFPLMWHLFAKLDSEMFEMYISLMLQSFVIKFWLSHWFFVKQWHFQ